MEKMSESTITTLKQIQGYKFKAEFDETDIPSMVVDESVPIGENSGPNPTRLLSVAIGHCLSSSLLYCLQKARVKVMGLQTTIIVNKEKNEEGFIRITSLAAKIQLQVNDEDKPRVPRCLKIFENYCTVTQSIRKGIKVNINIDNTDALLFKNSLESSTN